MNAKHTPGPWRQNSDDNAMSEYAVCAESFGHGFGSSVAVATQRDGRNPISRDEAMANARLIAAAPEIFCSLVELVEMFDKHDDCADVEKTSAARNKARAAIAKATGSAA